MKSPKSWGACSLRTRFRELEKLDASARPAATGLGVSIVMGVAQNRWFFVENPTLKWMMTGGTPTYGNPHVIKMRTDLTTSLILAIERNGDRWPVLNLKQN